MVDDDDEDIQHVEPSMPDICPPDALDHEEEAGHILTSSGQQLPEQATESMDGVDPEFWAAMPEDIRQELRHQQTSHASQTSRTRRSGRAGEASSSLSTLR